MHACTSRARSLTGWLSLVGGLLLVGFSGCAQQGATDRASPEPSSRATQAGDAQVASAMRRLSRQSERLASMLFGPSLPGPFDRPLMAEILADMESTAAQLEALGGPASHPLLREHIGDFRREIAWAREGLERDPPDYLQVAIVQGACVLCHARPPVPGQEPGLR